MNDTVKSDGGDQSAVRGKSNRVAGVPQGHPLEPAFGEVPEHELVIGGTSCQRLPVGRECDLRHPGSVEIGKRREFLARCDLPNSGVPIASAVSRNQRRPIGGKGDGAG